MQDESIFLQGITNIEYYYLLFIILRPGVIAPTILSPCLNLTPPDDRVQVSPVSTLGTA
jgi:hypothetical protein